MNVEDEYFSVIEKRDTTIMLKDRKIAEQTAQINEQTAQIRKSVQMLYQAGMSAETIAVNLGMDLKTVLEITEL